MTYDCMSADELALWSEQAHEVARRIGSGSSVPCVDCPIEFHRAEKAAGRCGKSWPVRGGALSITSEARRVQWREAAQRSRDRRKLAKRNRLYRANLRAQVDDVRASRARARGYNTVVGVSDVSATMRDGAAFGAYSTEGRAVAFPPGVRR